MTNEIMFYINNKNNQAKFFLTLKLSNKKGRNFKYIFYNIYII